MVQKHGCGIGIGMNSAQEFSKGGRGLKRVPSHVSARDVFNFNDLLSPPPSHPCDVYYCIYVQCTVYTTTQVIYT